MNLEEPPRVLTNRAKSSSRRAVVIITLALGYTLWPVSALGMVQLGQTGRVPSVPSSAVEISGRFAYVGDHFGRLRVVDVANPRSPTEIAFLDFGRRILHTTLEGDNLYLVDGLEVHAVDVSNPENPRELGTLRFFNGAGSVAASGSIAYVGASFSSHGIWIVDFSEPSAPATFLPLSGRPLDLEVRGDHLYVVNGGLSIFDISAPASPQEIGSLGTLFNRIELDGDLAYLSSGMGLHVVDVKDPTNPSEIGFVETPLASTDVAVRDGIAFVCDIFFLELRAVDVSDPTRPSLLGAIGTKCEDVEVSDHLAFVAGDDLRIIDVSLPSWPAVIGRSGQPGGGKRIEMLDGYAYTMRRSELIVTDVSNPLDPKEAGRVSWGCCGFDLAVVGQFAYVTAYSEGASYPGLIIIDISDPEQPVEVGSYVSVSPFKDAIVLDVADSFAYVGLVDGTLLVIDVSDAENPFPVGSVDLRRTPMLAVVVEGRFAYVATGGVWITIVDVVNPRNPREIGQVVLPGHRFTGPLDVVGNLLYASAVSIPGFGSIRIVDVANPFVPRFLSELSHGDTNEMRVQEGLLYVAGLGTKVFDVSNPEFPRELGSVATEETRLTDSVDVLDGLVYAAEDGISVKVIDFGPEYVPEPAANLLAAVMLISVFAAARCHSGSAR